MTRQRRVAVTSPQTRVALGRRHGPPSRLPHLTPAEIAIAARIRRAQLRRAVSALLAVGGFLVGLPIALALFPGLSGLRPAGIQLPWLAVAVLPYPAMAGLAWWQLRQAERVERVERADDRAADRADDRAVPRGPR
ncbi:hypothetical protein [Pseudonocardia sp. H11422]|uniref:hypothetical protein n=1 Tax=Pseudonocardia sp. H11422 TaxID=2835866 RepID=UPI001BDD8912|nr:hypothetical protein [Pseudonocardia sp. H11422]